MDLIQIIIAVSNSGMPVSYDRTGGVIRSGILSWLCFHFRKKQLAQDWIAKFRIQRPDKILLFGCLQHLVDSCLGCIAAKGNVGLAEIQSGKPDDLTILGYKCDLLIMNLRQ